jgi:hypothetical protein
MKSLLEQRSKLEIAGQIIDLGGRVPTIIAITGLTQRIASHYYKEYTGKAAVGGMLPFDDKWAIKTPMNCLHASYFFTIYKTIQQTQSESRQRLNITKVFISAYKMYKKSIQDPHMDIDRAWQIFQQVEISGSLILRTCGHCQTLYLSIKGYPRLTQFCPICDVVTDSKNRKRWHHKVKIGL